MAGLYDLGEGVWIRTLFTDPATGNPVDPATVLLKLLPPSASSPVQKAYPGDVVKEGTGQYGFLLTLDEQGYWQWRWEGENTAPVVVEGSLYVRRADL